MAAGFISQADAAVLLAARDVLAKLEKAALHESLPSREPETARVLGLGRFMEACNRAESAVFETLNVAHSHLRDDIATGALGRFRG